MARNQCMMDAGQAQHKRHGQSERRAMPRRLASVRDVSLDSAGVTGGHRLAAGKRRTEELNNDGEADHSHRR